MKRLITCLAVPLVLAFAVQPLSASEEPAWLDDFEKAKAEAAEKNLPILVNFTGSDWCHFCKVLEAEILSQDAFKAYAGESLVLFIADFPRENKPSEAVQKQNKALFEKYKVEGYPTVLLLDSQGEVLWTEVGFGSKSATPEEYVANLKKEAEKAGLTGSAAEKEPAEAESGGSGVK